VTIGSVPRSLEARRERATESSTEAAHLVDPVFDIIVPLESKTRRSAACRGRSRRDVSARRKAAQRRRTSSIARGPRTLRSVTPPRDREKREHELQQANDFHGVLLAMAGHDLRQPLQAIMSAHEWLARRLDTGSEREYLRRAEFAVTRLSEQLDMLIEVLRLHERSVDITVAPIALAPLFARLCRDNEDLANRNGLTFRTHLTRAAVMSDAVLLEGILQNLVRNALKYTGPGGRVLVGCRRRGALMKIEIYDTGMGIPSDKLSTVFEAFHRLDSTRADSLGLGLFVVRRAVNLLGHDIEVRSTVGRGSCFSILAKIAYGAPQWAPIRPFASPAQDRKLMCSPP
jgi:two-component system phosphate regulon sensor histidine kinase PhoR